MALALGHQHLASLPAAKNLGDRDDDTGMRVDMRNGAGGLDEVGLEQNRLSLDARRAQTQLAQTSADDRLEIVGVGPGAGNEHVGPKRRFVMIASRLESHPGRDGGRLRR